LLFPQPECTITTKGFIMVDFNPETHPGEFGLNTDEAWCAAFGYATERHPGYEIFKAFYKRLSLECRDRGISLSRSDDILWFPDEIREGMADAISVVMSAGDGPCQPRYAQPPLRADSILLATANATYRVAEQAVRQLSENS
jgi:hypothetical protein